MPKGLTREICGRPGGDMIVIHIQKKLREYDDMVHVYFVMTAMTGTV